MNSDKSVSCILIHNILLLIIIIITITYNKIRKGLKKKFTFSHLELLVFGRQYEKMR